MDQQRTTSIKAELSLENFAFPVIFLLILFPFARAMGVANMGVLVMYGSDRWIVCPEAMPLSRKSKPPA